MVAKHGVCSGLRDIQARNELQNLQQFLNTLLHGLQVEIAALFEEIEVDDGRACCASALGFGNRPHHGLGWLDRLADSRSEPYKLHARSAGVVDVDVFCLRYAQPVGERERCSGLSIRAVTAQPLLETRVFCKVDPSFHEAVLQRFLGQRT